KSGGNGGVGVEIVPEAAAETFVIGGLAGADGGKKRSPGVRHTATDGIEIETDVSRFSQQAAGEIVEREAARRRLFKEPLANQVAQQPVQRIAVGTRGGGEIGDFGLPGLD